MTNELRRVNKKWSQREPVKDDLNFYLSPLTRPYIIETAYSKKFVSEYQFNNNFAEDLFVSHYLKDKKIESILSLCCGFGSVERYFVSKLANVKQCLGLDIAEGALEAARKKASDAGMHCIFYEHADLNKYFWEKEKYDLVIANGALHHLRNLEGVIEGIRSTLKPDGILFACEYVGPSYQDHTIRQLEIINAAAFLVPRELRARKGLPSFMNKRALMLVFRLYSVAARQVKPEWSKWKRTVVIMLKKLLNQNKNEFDFGIVHISPKNYFLRNDPSECVRSAEIIPVINSYFSNVEIRPFGGGILQHAFDDNFYAFFDRDNPLHTKSLEFLCQLEKHFMATGEIGIENAFIIAKK